MGFDGMQAANKNEDFGCNNVLEHKTQTARPPARLAFIYLSVALISFCFCFCSFHLFWKKGKTGLVASAQNNLSYITCTVQASPAQQMKFRSLRDLS